MYLKKGHWLAVIDGAHGLVFVNEGTALEPDLKIVRSYGQQNPKTSEQGRDKPGRTFESVGVRRSSNEAPDLHRRAEDTFVSRIMHDLAKDAERGAFDEIVIAAPPVALGVLRKAAPKTLTARVRLWIDKDLTNEPVANIANTVAKILAG